MNLVNLAFIFIFLGFSLVFLDIILAMIKSVEKRREEKPEEEERKTEVGGVIFIGPVPIIFGTSKKIEKWMIIVALVITLVLVTIFLLQFA
ncbi:TIGR00304 family membrane protein [Metallosphaera cuprina]|uniref:DUF131 domain-containing protein n=1 Tax=Metallosphaera cuprina (strain Ar-4) TaxID=1006006 RepID=F4FYT5_METCR|nr:DUF131 domain-containing protein [Metallosphaera cuprina]AEB94324.1 conserved hypothetical protein [Metallosphaera cuprina Ar-4]